MKTSLVCAPVAALCLLAAGCGSAPAPAPTHVTADRTSSNHGAGPTLAGNRRLSRAEAVKLVRLVPVPPHASRLASAPVQPMMTPGVTGLADARRYWRLDMSFRKAAAWIAAHRPAGLKQTVSGSGGPPPTAGYGYAGPKSAAWGDAELDIEVVQATAHTTYMRADGYVAWLDPVPYKDTARGPRLRVLARGDCPATDKGIVGVRNPGAHLTRSLLPAGRPRAALRCSFYGANGKPFRLKRQQRLSPARAQALAAAIKRIPLGHEVGATSSCPAADETAVLVTFAYPGRPDVDLWAETTGCPGLSNGYIMVSGELP